MRLTLPVSALKQALATALPFRMQRALSLPVLANVRLLAAPGEVLISAATYALVQDYYECEALEPRKTKGRADFTVMYRVLKHKKRTGTLNLDNLDF